MQSNTQQNAHQNTTEPTHQDNPTQEHPRHKQFAQLHVDMEDTLAESLAILYLMEQALSRELEYGGGMRPDREREARSQGINTLGERARRQLYKAYYGENP